MRAFLFVVFCLAYGEHLASSKKVIETSLAIRKREIALNTLSPDHRVYRVTNVFDIVMHYNTNNLQTYLRFIGKATKDDYYTGFCEIDERILHCIWSGQLDRFGRRVPYFPILGHELWHLYEIGGYFHLDTDRRIGMEITAVPLQLKALGSGFK